jgi:polysaccharide biosynthesis transport protein
MQELQEYIVPSDASVKSDLSMKDFGKIWRRRRGLVGKIILASIILAILCEFIPHRYYSTAQVQLIQRVPSAQLNSQENYAAPWMEQVATPLDEIQTPMAYDRALAWMANDSAVEGIPKFQYDQSNFPKHVSVNNTKGSNTIDITAWAYTRRDADELAYAAAASFVAWKNDQAQQDVDEAIENYRVRVAESRDDMDLAQNRELKFKQQFQIADLGTEEKNDLDLMSNEESSLLQAKQTAASEDAKLKALQTQLSAMDQEIAKATDVRDDTTTQAIQEKLIETETDRATTALHYTPLFPNKLGDLDQRIADYRAQLAASVQGTINNNRPSLQDQDATLTAYRNQQALAMYADATLAAATNSYNAMFTQHNAFPARDLEYLRLDQDTETKTALYQSMVSALNQALTDKNSISGDVQMTAKMSSNEFNIIQYTVLFTVAGLLIGLFVAGCWVLLIEQIDTRLYTAEEVRRLLSGPIIGALPELSRREKKALSQGVVPNTIVEVFDVTRNNLQLVMRHYTQQELWDNQVILFASAGPDEGKSMIASQIARSIAQSGRTVLYVDANLRPDKERNSLSPRTPTGLAQVLTEGVDIDSVIVESEIENLSILPSGAAYAHTTDVISSPNMPDTIQKLRAKADVIIVDSPACAQATDALYLAPYTDAVIQVIALGSMDENVLADTIAALQAASPKVTAYALNRIPRPRRKSGRLHYYALELNGFAAKSSAAMLNGASAPLLTGATQATIAVGAQPTGTVVNHTTAAADPIQQATRNDQE